MIWNIYNSTNVNNSLLLVKTCYISLHIYFTLCNYLYACFIFTIHKFGAPQQIYKILLNYQFVYKWNKYEILFSKFQLAISFNNWTGN